MPGRQGYEERSERMLNQEMARQDLGPVEDGFAGPAGDGQGLLSLWLAARKEASTVLEREREHAAIEAQDVLTQADEALVMG